MAEDQNRSWNDRYMLRLPDGMRDRIKAVAEANNRSMNAEIVSALEDAFPPLSVVTNSQLEGALRTTRDALYSTDLTEDQKDELWERMMAAMQAGGWPI